LKGLIGTLGLLLYLLGFGLGLLHLLQKLFGCLANATA
jgi:hypothetical protein